MKITEKDYDLLHPVDLLEKMTDKIFGKNYNINFNRDFDMLFNKKHIPFVNISQTNDGVCLELAIPGYDKKDIEISIEKNLLTISCKKEESKQIFTRKEFSYNSFSRSFSLEESLDKDSIKTSMNNGILTIEISKLNSEFNKETKKIIPVN